jgi:hypothetical protein
VVQFVAPPTSSTPTPLIFCSYSSWADKCPPNYKLCVFLFHSDATRCFLKKGSKPQKGKKAHPQVLVVSLKTPQPPNKKSPLVALPPKHQLGRAGLVLHNSAEIERQKNAANEGAAEKETAERKEAELQAQAQAELAAKAQAGPGLICHFFAVGDGL